MSGAGLVFRNGKNHIRRATKYERKHFLGRKGHKKLGRVLNDLHSFAKHLGHKGPVPRSITHKNAKSVFQAVKRGDLSSL